MSYSLVKEQASHTLGTSLISHRGRKKRDSRKEKKKFSAHTANDDDDDS